MRRKVPLNEILKDLKEAKAFKDRIKTYKGEFYTLNSILGNTWARYYILLGGREAGKSYAVMRYAVTNKLKKGDNFKFYWLRLSDTQAKKLTVGGAKDLIDPDLRRKYNIKTMTIADTVYTYEEKITEYKKRDGTIGTKKEKENIKEFCRILSCATMYNTKGVGIFDNEFKGEYCLVLDEMNREEGEKNSFDIVYNFTNLVENLVRSTKKNIKIFMIGNTLDEASDLLSTFNFLPDNFGRYKLKRRRCVVDYIKPSPKYLERRKDTVASDLMPNASTFTNEVQIDRSLLINRHKAKYQKKLIKFGKEPDKWFVLFNDNIIKLWKNHTINDIIPMKRYLDAEYNQELVNNIIEMFDARMFRFTTLADAKRFQKNLKLIKKS